MSNGNIPLETVIIVWLSQYIKWLTLCYFLTAIVVFNQIKTKKLSASKKNDIATWLKKGSLCFLPAAISFVIRMISPYRDISISLIPFLAFLLIGMGIYWVVFLYFLKRRS